MTYSENGTGADFRAGALQLSPLTRSVERHGVHM